MGKSRRKRIHEEDNSDNDVTIFDLDKSNKKFKADDTTNDNEASSSSASSNLVETPVLRRSARRSQIVEIKDPIVSSSVFQTPPTTTKKRGRKKGIVGNKKTVVEILSEVEVASKQQITETPPSLLTLPALALEILMSYIDVKSLESLGQTCSFFDLLINGTYLTSLSLPFDAHFLKEVYNTGTIEKKPLLRLTCPKSKESFGIVFKDQPAAQGIVPPSPQTTMSDMSVHRVISDSKQDITDYLIHSQLSILNLEKLREIDLIPKEHSAHPLQSSRIYEGYKSFDVSIMKHLSLNSWLTNVTSLSIMVDTTFFLEDYVNKMPNLQELELVIAAKTGLSKYMFLAEYLARFEELVTKLTVSTLKLNVLSETRKAIPKVFKNKMVTKLTITGPCTFNVNLVMENLQELELKMPVAAEVDGDCCNFYKSKADDRKLHRAGLCVVNIGSVFENCPKLQNFMGIDLTSIKDKRSKDELTFSKWNFRMKRLFYDHYTKQGGTKEFKQWSKSRWFNKKPIIPEKTGRARIANDLHGLLFL